MNFRRLTKSIYKQIPLKRYAFTILKTVFPKRGKKFTRYLSFNGPFKVKVDDSTFKVYCNFCSIETDLFWNGYGSWEMQSLLLWKKLVSECDYIFDVGANTGIYSLVAAAIHPKAKVFAFEPMPRVFDKLKRNISLNSYSNVKCETIALSNYDGDATMYDLPDSDHTYGGTVNENLYNSLVNSTPVSVKVNKLDTYVKENKIERVDLVKIDVESHEKSVLEGMEEVINRYQPVILFEVWDFSELKKDLGTEIDKYLKKFDYEYFFSDDQVAFEPCDKVFSNMNKSSHNYMMFLAIPKENKLIRIKEIVNSKLYV